MNDKLYFKIYKLNESPEIEYHLISTISEGDYIGPELALEIQNQMNSEAQTATSFINMFTVSYIVKTNKIIITCNSSIYAFRVITQMELKTMTWNGPSFDRNRPEDINEIISNLDNFSKRYNSIIPFISGSIIMQPFNNIYIHATNLGNYNSIGCNNERTIIKKVPVSSGRHMMIFDQVLVNNDFNDCSNNTLRTLFFSLRSSRGDIIPLNGCNWSFSLIFSKANADL